jgi:ATP-dependent Lon protease
MQLPIEVPVMTLPNVILFPQAMLPLYVFEPRYRAMLADALASHRMFAVALQKAGHTRESPSAVAGLGLIRASVRNRDGTSNLVLQGIARVTLSRATRYRPYRVHPIRPLSPCRSASPAARALAQQVLKLVSERVELGIDLPLPSLHKTASAAFAEIVSPENRSLATEAFREVLKHLTQVDDPEQMADLVSATLLASAEQRQTILETPELECRLASLVRFLLHDLEHRKPPPAGLP